MCRAIAFRKARPRTCKAGPPQHTRRLGRKLRPAQRMAPARRRRRQCRDYQRRPRFHWRRRVPQKQWQHNQRDKNRSRQQNGNLFRVPPNIWRQWRLRRQRRPRRRRQPRRRPGQRQRQPQLQCCLHPGAAASKRRSLSASNRTFSRRRRRQHRVHRPSQPQKGSTSSVPISIFPRENCACL